MLVQLIDHKISEFDFDSEFNPMVKGSFKANSLC